MNVVLYMRFSSAAQTEQSIEGQRTVNTQFCKSHGYNIVGEYIDSGVSAYKDVKQRKQFLKMIKDSDSGRFQGVVVYALDRFARQTYDHIVYKKALTDNGVKLISATENLTDDPQSLILESVLQGFSQYYSIELSRKVKRGMNETAKKNNSTGGQLPFGYKVENKKLVIDELQAPYVKYIFDAYLRGESTTQIADYLNSHGVKTQLGKPFKPHSFQRLLKNRKYIGEYSYNGEVYGNTIPPIIDKETFNLVQEKINDRKQRPGTAKSKVKYLLSGKCVCGLCDGTLFGDTATSRSGEKYHYYTCPNRKKKTCTLKSAPQMPLERLVTTETIKFLNDDNIREIARVTAQISHDNAESDNFVATAEAKIKEIEDNINNLNQVLRYKFIKSTADLLEKLENERDDLLIAIADHKRNDLSNIFTEENVIQYLTMFKTGDVEDSLFTERLIYNMVEKVKVFPDKVEIVFKIKEVEPHDVVCSTSLDLVNQCVYYTNNKGYILFIGIIKARDF